MSHRSFFNLKFLSAVAWVIAGWSSPLPAEGHRLNVDCFVLPDARVQVEVYYDRGGSAADSAVYMSNAAGQQIAEAETNADGFCIFNVTTAEAYTFKAVIAGHRGTCKLSPEDVSALQDALSARNAPDAPQAATAPVSGAPRKTSRPVAFKHPHPVETSPPLAVNMLAGLGFILALAAFAMVLAQRKTIRDLQQRLGSQGPDPEDAS